jgi:hypothetical protein
MGGLFAFAIIGFDIYLCRKAWQKLSALDSSVKRKAVVLTLLACAVLVLAATLVTGIYFRHSNPYDWTLAIYIWAGWHFWLFAGLGLVFRNLSSNGEEGSLRNIIVSSAFFISPLAFGIFFATFGSGLVDFFEFYR